MSNVIDLPNKQKEKNMDDKLVDSVHEEHFDSNNLEMIKRGITGGLSMLNKAIETSDMPSDLTTMMFSVQKTLNNLRVLVNLVEHDMVGLIKNMEAQAAGQWTTQAHLQTLIETLKASNVITDETLEATWNELIPPMMEKMRDQSS